MGHVVVIWDTASMTQILKPNINYKWPHGQPPQLTPPPHQWNIWGDRLCRSTIYCALRSPRNVPVCTFPIQSKFGGDVFPHWL